MGGVIVGASFAASRHRPQIGVESIQRVGEGGRATSITYFCLSVHSRRATTPGADDAKMTASVYKQPVFMPFYTFPDPPEGHPDGGANPTGEDSAKHQEQKPRYLRVLISEEPRRAPLVHTIT